MGNFELAKKLFFEGLAFLENDNYEEAETKFQQSLELIPDRVSTLTNLSATYIKLRKFALAKDVSLKAMSLDQNSPESWQNLGLIERANHNYSEAINYFDKAIQLSGNYTPAWSMRGATLYDLKCHDEAISSFEKAIANKPDYAEAWIFKGNVLQDIGKIEDAIASYKRALDIKPDYFSAYSILLFTLNSIPRHTPEYLLEQSRQFGRIVGEKVVERFSSWQCATRPERLRVGLVSGDMRNHSVGHFLEGLLARIDPTRIELIAYPTLHEQDNLTERIRPYFSAWRPLFGKTDEAAARLIHADGVHVLLDLSGHTAYNRLTVFAWKPAPVQVTWLGFPATTGLEEMDYVLGDRHSIPEEFESHFSEIVWRLPESYLCLTVPPATVNVSSLPALSAGHMTFGSFNNLTKVTDAVVAAWVHILQSVPDSRLLLKAKQLSDHSVCEQTRQRFTARGIAPDRLQMTGNIASYEEHLASYNKVDIALDTFPYPGVTTSVEALWMGVPVLSLQGDRFLSCTAGSIAHNAGLPDWIAADVDDYVAKAVAFSSDLERLSALRTALRQQVLASPLFDAPRFAKNFEDALWEMWKLSKFSRK